MSTYTDALMQLGESARQPVRGDAKPNDSWLDAYGQNDTRNWSEYFQGYKDNFKQDAPTGFKPGGYAASFGGNTSGGNQQYNFMMEAQQKQFRDMLENQQKQYDDQIGGLQTQIQGAGQGNDYQTWMQNYMQQQQTRDDQFYNYMANTLQQHQQTQQQQTQQQQLEEYLDGILNQIIQTQQPPQPVTPQPVAPQPGVPQPGVPGAGLTPAEQAREDARAQGEASMARTNERMQRAAAMDINQNSFDDIEMLARYGFSDNDRRTNTQGWSQAMQTSGYGSGTLSHIREALRVQGREDVWNEYAKGLKVVYDSGAHGDMIPRLVDSTGKIITSGPVLHAQSWDGTTRSQNDPAYQRKVNEWFAAQTGMPMSGSGGATPKLTPSGRTPTNTSATTTVPATTTTVSAPTTPASAPATPSQGMVGTGAPPPSVALTPEQEFQQWWATATPEDKAWFNAQPR